jgi:hypothetical protein
LYALVAAAWIALWITSIMRHDADWFEFGIAVVFGFLAAYYAWLVRLRRRLTAAEPD